MTTLQQLGIAIGLVAQCFVLMVASSCQMAMLWLSSHDHDTFLASLHEARMLGYVAVILTLVAAAMVLFGGHK